jgi:hypothetical protein
LILRNHLNMIYLYGLQKISIFFETRYFLIYYLDELAYRQIKNCESLSSVSPYNV